MGMGLGRGRVGFDHHSSTYLFATNRTRHEWFQLRFVRSLQCLLIDVIYQLLAIQGTGRILGTFVVGSLAWWQKWILKRYNRLIDEQQTLGYTLTSGSTSFASMVISSGESCDRSSSTSTSSYAPRSLPYSLAGVVMVFVVVEDEVWKREKEREIETLLWPLF